MSLVSPPYASEPSVGGGSTRVLLTLRVGCYFVPQIKGEELLAVAASFRGVHFLLRFLGEVRVLRPSATKMRNNPLWVFLTASLTAKKTCLIILITFSINHRPGDLLI